VRDRVKGLTLTLTLTLTRCVQSFSESGGLEKLEALQAH